MVALLTGGGEEEARWRLEARGVTAQEEPVFVLLEVELQWGHRCGRCRDLCWARSGVWSSGGSSERLAVQVTYVVEGKSRDPRY